MPMLFTLLTIVALVLAALLLVRQKHRAREARLALAVFVLAHAAAHQRASHAMRRRRRAAAWVARSH
jgi:hypothetical protein